MMSLRSPIIFHLFTICFVSNVLILDKNIMINWAVGKFLLSFPRSRLCHNSEKHSISARHAGLDPASRSVMPWKSTGFRIKSGMTKQQHMQVWQLRHTLAGGNDKPGLKKLPSINSSVSFFSHSKFDVGRSMFDVHPFSDRCSFFS